MKFDTTQVLELGILETTKNKLVPNCFKSEEKAMFSITIRTVRNTTTGNI